MRKLNTKASLTLAFGVLAAIASFSAASSQTAKTVNQASFTDDGEAVLPTGYRQWVFVGSPLTPNAMNEGEAPFPEYHNVYVEPSAFEHWNETGTWAEGTQLVKELVLIRLNDNDENGATAEVSGIGYQQGEFAGLELTVKDSERYSDMAGGWAYFSFGHQPEPYAETAAAFPEDSCNSCHEANADDDFVFTQFYPVLRAAKP